VKQLNGQPVLRSYSSSDDKNANDNSLLLRLDFRRVRILLAGDLNTDSHQALLEDYTGNRIERRRAIWRSSPTTSCRRSCTRRSLRAA
jgi:hypothetical protein